MFGLVIAFSISTCSTVFAQSGPELLLKPWPEGHRVEFEGDGEATFPGTTSTEHSNDFNLATYDLSGRVRLYPQHRADPRFGWNYTQIHTSGDPNVPSDMVDVSIGLGVGVMDYKGWQAGITFGVGYAGTNAFNDANAWYGKGDFLIGRDLDPTSSIGFVLDYDGNRTYMPDVPLPGAVYTKQLYNKLSLAAGFPYCSVEYKPTTQLSMKGELYVPDSFSARINYNFVRFLGVFAQIGAREEAAHDNDLLHSIDRVFYRNRRVEAGLTWHPREWMSLIVAGGYMFNQQFNIGYDDRNQLRIATPRDVPYFRVGFELYH